MKAYIAVLCIFVVALSAAVQGATAQAPATKRRLIHTFAKPGFADIMVVLIDYPTGPQCVVMAVRMDRTKTKRAVAISTRQFNRIWAAFQASGADKYLAETPALSTVTSGALSATTGWVSGNSNYFFMAGNETYVVPKNKASPALTSLVTELRGYAK
ncbi:MAG: hypothetical protein M3128_03515 [Verrucomicrobiota bacterium]|nr:hypothetical protein [Verrucomicrobiota bacterium]